MSDRPILDPTLPAAMHEAVREDPDSLLPAEAGTEPVVHRARRDRAVRGAVVLVLAIALIAVVEHLFGRWWGVGAGCASLFLYLPSRAEEGRWRTPLGLGAMSIFPWWIWAMAMSAFGTWLPFGCLHLLTCGIFISKAPAREVRVPRDRFVLPGELAGDDRARLRRVQRAAGSVERAREVLAPGFDGRDALLVLREEEWRLAESMRRIAPLAEEIDALRSRAASDRVRAAMRPQVAVLTEARASHRAAVARIESYVRPVDRALAAHEEWEQCQRLAGTGDAYADVLAETRGRSHGALAGAPDLASDTALRAARLALSQRTNEAAEANAWLLRTAGGER